MIVPEKVLGLLLINYHLTGGKKVLTTDKDYNDFSIKVADKTAKLAFLKDERFYEVLRDKLHWGASITRD